MRPIRDAADTKCAVILSKESKSSIDSVESGLAAHFLRTP